MITRSGVKVGGQGQGIGHGVKSGEVGVKVWGQGCGQDRGSRSAVEVVVNVGVKVRGQGQGHDRWSQGRGSRSGVKVIGSRSGS